jgi:hypothetical protein
LEREEDMLKIEANTPRCKIETGGTGAEIIAEYGLVTDAVFRVLIETGLPLTLAVDYLAEMFFLAVKHQREGRCPDIAEMVNRIKEGGHA